jgi:hypothetical protein
MSENNNEQMDLGNTASSNVASDEPTAVSPMESKGAEKENSSLLKLTIKTPKEKKDIVVDPSSSVKQVSSISQIKEVSETSRCLTF